MYIRAGVLQSEYSQGTDIISIAKWCKSTPELFIELLYITFSETNTSNHTFIALS